MRKTQENGKNTGKVDDQILEKSGKFVSPIKWEPCTTVTCTLNVPLVRVFTEYLITLGHLLRMNRLRAYSL